MIKLNLAVLLAEKGLRVADLDRQSSIGKSTLHRMYNNKTTRIDFNTLNELCHVLDIEPGDLIKFQKDDPAEMNEK